MTEQKPNNRKERRYPGVYEKGIPFILGLIIIFFAILIGVALAVVFNIL
jgi:hypothetical protein